MGPVSIRQRADECLSQFKLLLKIEDEVRENGKAEAGNLNFTGLRADEQLARYEIWASNIGVFADGHAALDYRVRDSEDARQLMIKFLGTLWEFLQGGKEDPVQHQLDIDR